MMPVIEGMLQARPDAIVSVDTYKSGVARRAIEAGAEIVNDVSALQWDTAMATHLRRIAMRRGADAHPRTAGEWRKLPPSRTSRSLVTHDLANRAQIALDSGVKRERIVLDPGFGFGKNFEENYPLLAHLDQLTAAGISLCSREPRANRSWAARLASGGAVKTLRPSDRLYGSLAAMVASILRGAHIVRVHDVQARRRSRCRRRRSAGRGSIVTSIQVRHSMNLHSKRSLPIRVSPSADLARPTPGGRCVVYWMQRAQRALDNPALDVAVEVANALNQPVVIFFAPVPFYPHANLRHYAFLAQGIPDIAERARQREHRIRAAHAIPNTRC